MRLDVCIPAVPLSLQRLEREDVAVDEGQRVHELIGHSSEAQYFSYVRILEIVRSAAVRVAAASSDEALAQVQPRALLSVLAVPVRPLPSVVRVAHLRNRAIRQRAWIRIKSRVFVRCSQEAGGRCRTGVTSQADLLCSARSSDELSGPSRCVRTSAGVRNCSCAFRNRHRLTSHAHTGLNVL